MKKCLHPGIMPLLDSGTERTAPPQSRQILYMLMPLYTGGSLWDVVHEQSETLSNAQILSILEQVSYWIHAQCCCVCREMCTVVSISWYESTVRCRSCMHWKRCMHLGGFTVMSSRRMCFWSAVAAVPPDDSKHRLQRCSKNR